MTASPLLNIPQSNIVPLPLWSLGFMSGTSLDGVDAAIIRTDGIKIYEKGPATTLSYSSSFRGRLKKILGQHELTHEILDICHELMLYHIQAAKSLNFKGKLDLIGLHGQTLFHQPRHNHILAKTWQLSEPTYLVNEFQCPVVYDFRTDDIINGGQGAPLVPLYHQALMKESPKPVGVLNIGGVANLTIIDQNFLSSGDTGPGIAYSNDYCQKKLNIPFDPLGSHAEKGIIQHGLIQKWLDHSFFQKPFPKSLDRNDFQFILSDCEMLNTNDALATIIAFTAETIVLSLPNTLLHLYICGGGRYNQFLLKLLRKKALCTVSLIDDTQTLNGDFTEAEAFAFLAVRRLYNMHTSLPSTTGVSFPTCGGKILDA
jgi:anhydro-N-acetylmuramic acid kinase